MDSQSEKYIEHENNVINKFKTSFNNSNLHIDTNFIIKEEVVFGSSRFDAVILTGDNQLFASIEIKYDLKKENAFLNGQKFLEKAFQSVKTQYCILTDGVNNYYWDTSKNIIPSFEEISFDDLIKLLVTPFRKDNNINVYKIIKEKLQNEKLDDLEKKFTKDDIFFNGSSFSFSEKFEKFIISKLLKNETIDEVCRYVPYETAFQILKNKTIRMNGIVGMNDNTEINFIEQYVTDSSISFGTKTDAEIEKINSTFILSCSKKKMRDNLTQWRLYADDAKGVCLVFNVKKNCINKKYSLRKIKYINDENMPKEIDFLKEVLKEVYDKTKSAIYFKLYARMVPFL